MSYLTLAADLGEHMGGELAAVVHVFVVLVAPLVKLRVHDELVEMANAAG